MACHGCVPEKECAYMELRSCVRTKGVESCGLCDDYPCEVLNGAFEKTKKLQLHAAKVCTQEEMDMLHKAFFSKKGYFDRVHQDYLKKA